MKTPKAIGEHLLQRLHEHGVGHIFGIPGDYALGFCDQIVASPLRFINTCDEQGAGFAADAYARVRGLGAVCVTWCVGGLKLANTTAEAFAEKSPVVVISGAPGMHERERNPLLHHKVREFDTQKKVFEQLTVASAVLDDPQTARREIDRVLDAALRFKRPVYLELPRDIIAQPAIGPLRPRPAAARSDPKALRAAVAEAVAMLNAAKRPVILADVEVHRFGLSKALLQLARRARIPVAATILGKSVVAESDPLYLGVYEGAMGREEVRRYVESADCVFMPGFFMTDLNLGIFTARLDLAKSIVATSEKLAIGYHNFEGVEFADFLKGLLRAPWRSRPMPRNIPRPPEPEPFKQARGAKAITVRRLFQRLNAFLDRNTVVVADVGDSLFGAADLFIRERTEFLAPAYYTSMGFAVPAGVGAQLADPRLRPLVLVGDGAFQMTGVELSTAARYGLNPIVVVLNNDGYGTERHIHEGPYNDVQPWQFYRVPEVIGAGRGHRVGTEEELETALRTAAADRSQLHVLDVQLARLDQSAALQRLGRRMGRRV